MAMRSLDVAHLILGTAMEKDATLKLNAFLWSSLMPVAVFSPPLGRMNGSAALRTRKEKPMARSHTVRARAIFKWAQEQNYLLVAVNILAQGRTVHVPGSVLIRSAEGDLVGAARMSGDTSDNDEACAVAAIKASGLQAAAG